MVTFQGLLRAHICRGETRSFSSDAWGGKIEIGDKGNDFLSICLGVRADQRARERGGEREREESLMHAMTSTETERKRGKTVDTYFVT